MMPALGRGIQNLYIGMNISDWPNVDIIGPLYVTQALIIGMILLAAWKYNKLKHPATLIAISVNLFILLLEPLGRSEKVQMFLKEMIKG
jgi:peptidoglycan/LPS O-acetylase OafA/YrhL